MNRYLGEITDGVVAGFFAMVGGLLTLGAMTLPEPLFRMSAMAAFLCGVMAIGMLARKLLAETARAPAHMHAREEPAPQSWPRAKFNVLEFPQYGETQELCAYQVLTPDGAVKVLSVVALPYGWRSACEPDGSRYGSSPRILDASGTSVAIWDYARSRWIWLDEQWRSLELVSGDPVSPDLRAMTPASAPESTQEAQLAPETSAQQGFEGSPRPNPWKAEDLNPVWMGVDMAAKDQNIWGAPVGIAATRRLLGECELRQPEERRKNRDMSAMVGLLNRRW